MRTLPLLLLTLALLTSAPAQAGGQLCHYAEAVANRTGPGRPVFIATGLSSIAVSTAYTVELAQRSASWTNYLLPITSGLIGIQMFQGGLWACADVPELNKDYPIKKTRAQWRAEVIHARRVNSWLTGGFALLQAGFSTWMLAVSNQTVTQVFAVAGIATPIVSSLIMLPRFDPEHGIDEYLGGPEISFGPSWFAGPQAPGFAMTVKF